MSGLFKKIADNLSKRAFERAERSGKIDENTAFFRVAPSVWRFVDSGRCIHFYCETNGGKISIDMRPLGQWATGTHMPFTQDLVLEDRTELSTGEQRAILAKIGGLPWVRELVVLHS